MVLSANGKICVVGLGYVGLPIALEFANHFETVGYDISKQKITQLRSGVDLNGEIAEAVFFMKNVELVFHMTHSACQMLI